MILLLAACGPLEAEPEGVLRAEGPFVIARAVQAGPLPRPRELDALTPAAPAALGAGTPSEGQIRLRATFDPAELERVFAWEKADAQGFNRVMPPIDAQVCSRLRARRAPGNGFSWHLAECADSADAQWFTGADVDAEAAVRWSVAMGMHGPPPEVGLARAPELVARLGAEDDLLSLLGQLCETDRPELAGGLRAVLAAAQSAEARDRLAAACPHQTDPELNAAHAQGCEALDCEVSPDVLLDLDAALADPTVLVPALLARHPAHRGAILDAAERCALDVNHAFSAHCLAALAVAHRTRARRAAAISAPSADPAMAGLQASLDRFSDLDDLRAHLRELELIGDAPTDVRSELDGGAFGELSAHGRVVPLDWDAHGWHAQTAERLARATRELPGVRFDEIPPPGVPSGQGMLRAWDGDRRWHVMLPPDGTRSVIPGLVNALLIARGSEVRVAEVASRQAFAWGPQESLRSLHDDRLLLLAEFDDDGADAY